MTRGRARIAWLLICFLAALGCSSSNNPTNPATAGSAGAPTVGTAGAAGTSGTGFGGAAGSAVTSSGGASGAAGAPAASTAATLSALAPSLGALLPNFDASKLTYTLRVPHAATSVAVTPTATAPNATIQVNGAEVPSGQASAPIPVPSDSTMVDIVIVVSAAGRTTTTYTVHVSPQALSTRPTVYSVGDSTMADYQITAYPNQRGWMQMLPKFVTGDVSINNFGQNGTSTKSFYLSAAWFTVKAKLNAGDYVFIQFAHNDEKDGGIEGASGVGTAAFGSYQDYLTKYVEEARSLGAIPILFTPVVRLDWNGTMLTPVAQHDLTGNGTAVGDAKYPEAMRAVATKLAVPLVDLTPASKALVEQYGPTDAKSMLYVSTDNTHLQPMGATVYAQLAVKGLIAQNILGDHLNSVLPLELSQNSLAFGSRYLGSQLDRVFSVFDVSLTPAAGNVTISAPAGFLVGTDPASMSRTLQLPYLRGALPPTTVYARFQPATPIPYTAALTVTPGSGSPTSITLSGTGLAVPTGGTEVEVRYPLDTAASVACVTVTGTVTCLPEAFAAMYVKDYAPLTTLLPVPTTLPTQRVSISSPPVADTWPLETAGNPARYVEFAFSVPGKSVSVDTVSLYVGAAGPSLGLEIKASAHGDFSAPVQLLAATDAVPTQLDFHSFGALTSGAVGEAFRVRVYPYSTAAASKRYLSLQSVSLHGVAY